MFGFQFLDAFLQLGDLGLELPVFLFQVGNAGRIAFLLGRFLLGRFDGLVIGGFVLSSIVESPSGWDWSGWL